MIFESVVSFPILFDFTFINPEKFIVPLCTKSPFLLSFGTLSPVKADSSIEASPSTMMPSTGIFSPGLIIKISSRLISSILIVFSSPFF